MEDTWPLGYPASQSSGETSSYHGTKDFKIDANSQATGKKERVSRSVELEEFAISGVVHVAGRLGVWGISGQRDLEDMFVSARVLGHGVAQGSYGDYETWYV